MTLFKFMVLPDSEYHEPFDHSVCGSDINRKATEKGNEDNERHGVACIQSAIALSGSLHPAKTR